MKQLVVGPAAKQELREAGHFYEERRIGLGESFFSEVERTAQRILEHPEAWPLISGEIRRCLVNRFPFALLFRVEPQRIYVLAIMHLCREPNYWRTRS